MDTTTKRHARRVFSLDGLAGRSLLALLSTALLGAYALLPSAAFIPYFCLVPWVILYADDRRPSVSSLYYIVATWIGWMILYRQAWRFGWFAPPIMALFFVYGWWPFAPALRLVHARCHLPRALVVPVLWTSVEWIRNEYSLAHFDLYGLGYSQARFPILIQIADVTGVYGLTFLVAAVNGLVADAYLALRDARWSWRGLIGSRRLLVATAIVGSAFAAVSLYGVMRLSESQDEEGPRVALVQPNVRHTLRNVIGVHLAQVLLTESSIEPGATDLIVWPENAILDDIRREGAWLEDLRWLAARKRAPMLVGAQGEVDNRPGRTTNSAFLIDAERGIVGEYSKQVLFPWSEYIPLDDFFGRVWPGLQRAHRTLTRKGWGYLTSGSHGSGIELLPLPWNGTTLPFAALICVENAYPPVPAEAARLGARFFVNITSEGEVGGVVQEQMLRICILRAVENRISYVRCGNTGISGFIDPRGRVRTILRGKRGGTISDAGVAIDRVPLSAGTTTLYTRSGDVFATMCLLASGILILLALLRPRHGGAVALVLAATAVVTGGCVRTPGLGSDPALAAAALADGRRLLESGRPAQAARTLQRACAEEAACAQALISIASAYRATEAAEDAGDFFAAVAAKWPTLAAEARGYRAYFLDRAGDIEGAAREYAESLRLAPNVAVRKMYGAFLVKIGRDEEAIRVYRELEPMEPGDARLSYVLARALAAHGENTEARARLEDLVIRRPEHSPSWALLGRLRWSAGDRAGADVALRRAVEADPANIEARYYQARIAMRDERFDEVERLYREIATIEAGLGRGPREE